jgi:hypothetical protein
MNPLIQKPDGDGFFGVIPQDVEVAVPQRASHPNHSLREMIPVQNVHAVAEMRVRDIPGNEAPRYPYWHAFRHRLAPNRSTSPNRAMLLFRVLSPSLPHSVPTRTSCQS